MANKRELKKTIRYMCGDLAVECLLAAEYLPGLDADKMRSIVFDIADLQENSLGNSNIAFEKSARDFESVHEYRKAKCAYYKKAYKSFAAEFNKHITEIVKNMNGMLTAEQRELNKQIANS